MYKQVHGEEQALKIIANERLVFERIDAFVKEHGVPCDFNPATTFDVCLTREFADFNARSFREYRDAGGDVSHVRFYEGEEARRVTRIDGAVAAYEWPAGSSHPAKLAQWLLARSVERGVRLFTHCPATAVTKSAEAPADRPLWDVATPRGTTRAATVVHCTNAFAPHLLPQLAGFVTPNRAQAHAFVPPPPLSGASILPSTMSLRHTLKHFYSVMQRAADGVVILGAPRSNPNVSAAARAGVLSADDGAFDAEVRDDAVDNFEACFPACERRRLRHGEGLLHVWTGIIGMTTDSVPFVGRIESLPGQWICAGFNGHGKRHPEFYLPMCNAKMAMSRDGEDIHLCSGSGETYTRRLLGGYGVAGVFRDHRGTFGKAEARSLWFCVLSHEHSSHEILNRCPVLSLAQKNHL